MNVGSTGVNHRTCFAGRSLKWMLSGGGKDCKFLAWSRC